MIQRIDHLGIAVENLEEAILIFERLLGQKCLGVEVVESQKVRTAFFRVGDVSVELLEPVDGQGAVGAFLEKRGMGLHHVALLSDDVPGELSRLASAGTRLVDEVARPGANGREVAFIHPKSAQGVLVELCGMAQRDV